MNTLFLLGTDTLPFFKWWLASILFGIGFYPLGAVLFRKFDDKGWIFSKILGIGLGGYLVFLWGSAGILPFRSLPCILITLAVAVLCWILFLKLGSEELKSRPKLNLIIKEELLFLAFFFFWTWCSGFRPEAHGTEKPMDYGFMAAMMRSDSIPAKDIWYSEGNLNYYYGGQFYAVYLTKLTLTRVNETYHLMRALVAAFCFATPWSLIRQALHDRGLGAYLSEMGGLFAGAAVSLAGNAHYLFYGLFGNAFKLTGYDTYWFPDSTRYIGHNPLTDDQCIHEFPSYSFVLGDLHAHVVNLFLVMAFIGIMYAWFQQQEEEKTIWQPYTLAAGVLIGIFKWTNFWDFIIYLTVFLFSAVCVFYRKREKGRKIWIRQIGVSLLVVYIIQTVIAFPFTSAFDSMFKGVGLSIFHTRPYQFLILWGVPVLVSVLLALMVVRKKIHYSDCFFVMLAVCGLGLIFIPELIYVKDIYQEGYARSNTMFKLTYQAFVMFGLMMSYAFFRILCIVSTPEREAVAVSENEELELYSEVEDQEPQKEIDTTDMQTETKDLPLQKKVHQRFNNKKRNTLIRIPTAFLAAMVFLTFAYSGYAVNCWFGNILDPSGYRGLDATSYLENQYPEDAQAIRYLDKQVSGQAVVLEAPGDSYSDHCRVSAMTGLPTIEGWYVHEWLWRDDPQDLNLKKEDIRQIYTNEDPAYVRQLLNEYQVSWIFIGSCEREEYGEDLNEDLLRSLGEVCFDGEAFGIENGACVIDVRQD